MNYQPTKVRLVAYILLLTLCATLPLTTPAQRRTGGRRSASRAAAPLTHAHLCIVKNREPLPSLPLYPLPLTSVKPRGWLRRQLQIQAEGVTGNIDEFWKDLNSNSGWLGGTGEDWERGPYYMDGLIPLAFLLDDPKLMANAHKWVGWTLANQRPDGSIGPVKNDAWWSRTIMLKVLTQYYEATGDRRVIPLMSRYADHHLAKAKEKPLTEWAKYRWGDEVLGIIWLYNRTGDEKLLGLARLMHAQGFDWRGFFADFKFTEKTSHEMLGLNKQLTNNTEVALSVHGVNNGMALKTETLWSQISQDAGDRRASLKMLETLDRYHGLPNGMFSGDEHLAGTHPSQGVETCAVVETMFSLEQLISITGDVNLADRLEKLAFNALPGAFTGDMRAHQYDQQPNQIRADKAPRQWSTNGDEANVFGFEPWFGCCTANQHQGFPKFAAHLWMGTGDNGLAAVAYAPSEVNTYVNNNVPVSVIEKTEYPFRPTINLAVNPARPVAFPLKLRIPAWAEGAVVTINGVKQTDVRAGTFYTVARTWKAGDRVELTLPLRARTSRWMNDSIAIERGPLVFSLRIGEAFRRTTAKMNNPAPPEAIDYEVRPTSAWNYGLVIPEGDIERSIEVVSKSVGEYPFTAAGTPVELRVKARRVPEWKVEQNSAGAPPQSPVTSREPIETVTLIPYGAAKLRITAFPQIK